MMIFQILMMKMKKKTTVRMNRLRHSCILTIIYCIITDECYIITDECCITTDECYIITDGSFVRVYVVIT